MGRTKKNRRRFQSNRKTGLLFVTRETYDTAIAKMPEAKRPDAINAALAPDDPEAVDLFDILIEVKDEPNLPNA